MGSPPFEQLRERMNMVTIRRGQHEDAGPACDVVRRSIQELCFADHQGDELTLSSWLANKTVSWFEQLLTSESRSCVVATIEGQVCAFGLLMHPSEIGLLYVAPEARFRCASSLMLDWLEAEAMRLGAGEVTLASTLTARQFYSARGYVQSGESRPGFGITMGIPMKKRLIAEARVTTSERAFDSRARAHGP